MSIYQELGLDTIINASDTYTWMGGSRMSDRTLEAMREAGQSFVNLDKLSTTICDELANRTGNEAAFISSGAGACVVLTVSACMTRGDATLEYALPDASGCPRNEVVLFASQKECAVLPYWHLAELSGAKLVPVEDNVEALTAAIGKRTACVLFFAGTVYEWTTPNVRQVIAAAHSKGVPVIVDAAAQLPPKSLFSYYTCELGADIVIFSGGKFINGPQTTGIALGKKEVLCHCKALASPNVRIGRPYKVGKEEYAGLYRACVDFLEADEQKTYAALCDILHEIVNGLHPSARYRAYLEERGRLGQAIPMLYLQLLDGTTGEQAHQFMAEAPNRVDVGKFNAGDPTGDPHRIFINPINLRAHETARVIEKLNQWIDLV